MVGVGLIGLGGITLVSLVAFANAGQFGYAMAAGFHVLFGLGAYLVPFLLAYAGFVLIVGTNPTSRRELIGSVLILVVTLLSWWHFAHTIPGDQMGRFGNLGERRLCRRGRLRRDAVFVRRRKPRVFLCRLHRRNRVDDRYAAIAFGPYPGQRREENSAVPIRTPARHADRKVCEARAHHKIRSSRRVRSRAARDADASYRAAADGRRHADRARRAAQTRPERTDGTELGPIGRIRPIRSTKSTNCLPSAF